MAYDFIHRNMPEALPSLRTIQNVIYKEYVPFCEGYFRFDDLLQHLVKHKAPFMVTLAEDATRIVKNIEYDAVSSNCVSFFYRLTEMAYLYVIHSKLIHRRY